MKTLTLVSLVTLSLIYATAEVKTPPNPADLEYEHQLHSTTSVEDSVEDMSKMKAMGKCGADQKADKGDTAVKDVKPSEAELEYEHNLHSTTSVEDSVEDMSKMKAMGKCGADQKAHKDTPKEQNASKAELEYEHNLRLANDVEESDENMGNMKAMGKCGSSK